MAQDVTNDADLLDYPVPGSLTTLSGISGWIKANNLTPAAYQAWLTAHPGVEDAFPGSAHTLSQVDHVQTWIDAGLGYVAVEDSLCDDINVGYVFADAVGNLTVSVQNVHLSSADPNAALQLTGQEIWALLDGVLATVDVTVTALGVTIPGSVTFDLGKLKVTSVDVPGITNLPDPIGPWVQVNLENLVNGQLPTSLTNPLGSFNLDLKLSDIFALIPPLNFSPSVNVPYSFGLAYTNLTNGNWAEIDPQAAVDNSWLQYLDGNSWSGPVSLTNIPVGSSNAATVIADALSNALSNALTSIQNPVAGAIAGLLPTIENLLANNLTVDIPFSVPTGLGGITIPGTASLSNPRMAANASDVLMSNLFDLINTKAGTWLPTILNNATLNGSVSTSFTAGAVRSLALSDVTFGSVTHLLDADKASLSLQVGESADVTALIAALSGRLGGMDSLTFDLDMLDGTLASFTSTPGGHEHYATVTGLAEGNTTLQVAATVACGADTTTYRFPVNIDVAGLMGPPPTTPPPTTPTTQPPPTPAPTDQPTQGPIQGDPPEGKLPFTGNTVPVFWTLLLGLSLAVVGAKVRRSGRLRFVKHRA